MELIHVTSPLSVYLDFGGVNKTVLDEAKRRGTMIHSAAAAYASGAFVVPVVPIYEGFYQSFKTWFDSYVDRVFFVEQRIEDAETYGITGMIDLGCQLIDGRAVIVDHKTPLAESKTWKGQLSAYRYLAKKKYGIDFECISLRLDINGAAAKARVYEYSDNDFMAFVHALSAYRYFKF
jgi:hypothetical protein